MSLCLDIYDRADNTPLDIRVQLVLSPDHIKIRTYVKLISKNQNKDCVCWNKSGITPDMGDQ